MSAELLAEILGADTITPELRVELLALLEELDAATRVVEAVRSARLAGSGGHISYRSGSIEFITEAMRQYDGGVPVPTLQERAAAWHAAKYPSSNQWKHWAKVTEELGEIARAMVGDEERRPGRGDVGDEAAQLVLTLCTLIGRWYPTRDLLLDAHREIARAEAEAAMGGI